jgi:beta-phosphoglucomutase-like phosphatase (HAD superfamily)/capsular polysaccharide biosynthesis protein/dTDP-glucose pyrophosphorylase
MSQRLFIFDLDGVLVDSKKIHFDSLNLALKEVDEKYVITQKQQAEVFEGLPTKEKLSILTATRGLPIEDHKKIWNIKQEKSIQFFKELKEDRELIDLFKIIKEYQVKIAVASNCIKETVETCLKSLGVINYVDLYLSNEDVSEPKPSPEIYLKCMKTFSAIPYNTVIFEDSLVGRTAAHASGARLVSISNRSSINQNLIINELSAKNNKINVLIPMAGEGSRFAAVGYTNPKPMIDVNGKSMINLVHDNIGLDAHYIFVAKSEHIEKYNLKEHIATFCKDFTIISQEERLQGAAKSALLAKDLINNDDHLIIANSDQKVDWDSLKEVPRIIKSGVDGAILTFKSDETKWSYAEVDHNKLIKNVAEKIVISDNATCGIYYWNKGSDFVKYSEQMIEKDIKTNNEFYICPSYNEAVLDEKLISAVKVNGMQGLGTPEDLDVYLNKNISFVYNEHIDYIKDVSYGEVMVKVNKPTFNVFTLNKDFIPKEDIPKVHGDNDFGRWSISKSFKKLDGKEVTDINLNFYMYPAITKFHNKKEVDHPGRSVYFVSYTAKYFHMMLEILPRLFAIKEIDPNFKLILVGNQDKDENGIFIGLQKEKYYAINGVLDHDASHLRYWLDKLEIDFECINLKDLISKEFNFDSAYIFYEKRRFNYIEEQDSFNKIWFMGHELIYDDVKHDPHHMYYRTHQGLDITLMQYLKKHVLKLLKTEYPNIENKKRKIYISRKNFSRYYENEKEIESYYNSLGYETVYFEDLNPLDQIKICKESSDIACYLGSSIVNAYFADPGTNLHVLSLDDPNMPDFKNNTYDYYKTILTVFGIKTKMLDIETKQVVSKSNTDEIFKMTNVEICIKHKNPSYQVFDFQVKKSPHGFDEWDRDLEMIELPKAAESNIDRGWMLYPILTKNHSSKEILYPNRSVYLTPYTSRFFHVYLEILPRLLFLKDIDPNFKLIILGSVEINEKGDFVSFYGSTDKTRESDATCFKFWLDKLEIDYKCINIRNMKEFNFNFESSYVFYESVQSLNTMKTRIMHSKRFLNGPFIHFNKEMFHPSCVLGVGDATLEKFTNEYLVEKINNMPEIIDVKQQAKKIYISRKNYRRVHPDEIEIEKYFISEGFESVCMEDLDPIEQIKLCKESSDIACYLGSSLVNMYFINEDTNLIVMSLDSTSDPNFIESMLIYYSNMINKKVNLINVQIPDRLNREDITAFMNRILRGE